jgi:putative SOS response-associated peptidase YedK
MCGRFTQTYTWAELVALYGLTQPAMNLQPRYNITPTATIDVLIPRNSDQLELWPMRWGLIPSWWTKTRKELPSTFNARAETITARPMFRDAFRERRCIIPASGYYEWKPTPTGKQPYYISARDGSPLPFAGLWDEWHDPEDGQQIRSCTIIVTDANALTRPIHDRMPVVLVAAQQTAWLASAAAATELLRPAPNEMLQMWPVSRRVNRADNENDPKLINAGTMQSRRRSRQRQSCKRA